MCSAQVASQSLCAVYFKMLFYGYLQRFKNCSIVSWVAEIKCSTVL